VTIALVLDTEALSNLTRHQDGRLAEVRAALEAARRPQRDVITPAVILAGRYRGPGHNQVVDSCLSRESWIKVRDTDRASARFVGAALGPARAHSTDMADAHAVAPAVEAGGAVMLTGDRTDLRRLAASYPNVHVRPI